MADPLPVAVLDAGDELSEVGPRSLLVEAARRHDLVKELPAGDELEHDEDLGAAGEHLVSIDSHSTYEYLGATGEHHYYYYYYYYYYYCCC